MCTHIRRYLFAGVACVASSVSIAGAAAEAPTPATVNPHVRLPIVFEPNVGQFAPGTRLAARIAGGVLRFSDQGISIDRGTSRVRWTLRGGRRVAPQGVDRSSGMVNYLVGRDPQSWHTHVPTYARVRYAEVYGGIDIEYYANGDGLEFDVRVAPGSDPGHVRFAIDGARRVHVDTSGAVVMDTADGELTWRAPVAYQNIAGTRQPVSVAYLVDGREVRFRIGRYDRTRPLVIDPVFAFSTLLPGSGYDVVTGVTVDDEGFGYLTGVTESLTFPNPDPANRTRPFNVFVVKLTPDGSHLVYASFIGGTADGFASAIAVDDSGHAYITGSTQSADWPTMRAIQPRCGGYLGGTEFCLDVFVAELGEGGDALEFSTYLGGTGQDESLSIALDPQNRIAVSGVTSSTDFPVPDAFNPTCHTPCDDGFVVLMSPGGRLLERGTYLGGTGNEQVRGIGFLPDGRVAAAGWTNSPDFPVTQAPLGPVAGGDAFVAVFSPNGSGLDASGRLGGTSGDDLFGMAVGPSGDVYVTGFTGSPDFPVRNAAQPSMRGVADAFVTRLHVATWSIVYSTYWGGSRLDGGNAISVDQRGDAIIAGATLSFDLPTLSAQQRASAVVGCDEFMGVPRRYCGDAMVAAFDASGRVLFSTYVGDQGDDQAMSVSVSRDGSAWVAGATSSSYFPTTPFAFHRTSPIVGTYEPFVVRFVPPDATRILTTFAGSGDDRSATPRQAVLKELGRPSDVAMMPDRGVLIIDSALNRAFVVGGTNSMRVHAGSGAAGFRDDFTGSAEFNGPSGLAVDGQVVYVADTQNHGIRAILTLDGRVITIAGNGAAGFSGDGGPSTQAQLSGPLGLAAGPATLIVADTGNRRIRRITADGIITTIAGTGDAGSSGDGGPAAAAMLTLPTGVAFDPSGGIVIADWGANVVRRIAPDGTISTIAGTGAPGYGGDDGPATAAQLNGPYGVDVDAHGRVYVTDMFNHRVRMIAPDGTIHTVAGTGVPGPIAVPQRSATESPLWYPAGVAVGIDNDLFITDLGNQRVARVIRIDGTVP